MATTVDRLLGEALKLAADERARSIIASAAILEDLRLGLPDLFRWHDPGRLLTIERAVAKPAHDVTGSLS